MAPFCSPSYKGTSCITPPELAHLRPEKEDCNTQDPLHQINEKPYSCVQLPSLWCTTMKSADTISPQCPTKGSEGIDTSVSITKELNKDSNEKIGASPTKLSDGSGKAQWCAAGVEKVVSENVNRVDSAHHQEDDHKEDNASQVLPIFQPHICTWIPPPIQKFKKIVDTATVGSSEFHLARGHHTISKKLSVKASDKAGDASNSRSFVIEVFSTLKTRFISTKQQTDDISRDSGHKNEEKTITYTTSSSEATTNGSSLTISTPKSDCNSPSSASEDLSESNINHAKAGTSTTASQSDLSGSIKKAPAKAPVSVKTKPSKHSPKRQRKMTPKLLGKLPEETFSPRSLCYRSPKSSGEALLQFEKNTTELTKIMRYQKLYAETPAKGSFNIEEYQKLSPFTWSTERKRYLKANPSKFDKIYAGDGCVESSPNMPIHFSVIGKHEWEPKMKTKWLRESSRPVYISPDLHVLSINPWPHRDTLVSMFAHLLNTPPWSEFDESRTPHLEDLYNLHGENSVSMREILHWQPTKPTLRIKWTRKKGKKLSDARTDVASLIQRYLHDFYHREHPPALKSSLKENYEINENVIFTKFEMFADFVAMAYFKEFIIQSGCISIINTDKSDIELYNMGMRFMMEQKPIDWGYCFLNYLRIQVLDINNVRYIGSDTNHPKGAGATCFRRIEEWEIKKYLPDAQLMVFLASELNKGNELKVKSAGMVSDTTKSLLVFVLALVKSPHFFRYVLRQVLFQVGTLMQDRYRLDLTGQATMNLMMKVFKPGERLWIPRSFRQSKIDSISGNRMATLHQGVDQGRYCFEKNTETYLRKLEEDNARQTLRILEQRVAKEARTSTEQV
ncbi:hypothetical protein BON22_2840 [Cyberlindnera fabianii]|uniref:Uncharacterized protein n=1 Tax=Cyberlindnera fabianii TaxID=36022 RepID=A0A1V2L6H7_CYBFA|nr:hypothetical protein BON22_2840 [Cyberlindnera fabianii]